MMGNHGLNALAWVRASLRECGWAQWSITGCVITASQEIGVATGHMKEPEKQIGLWLAGIIDGEGSIHISRVTERKNKSGFAFHPILSITNTNESILSNVKHITACGSICRVRSLRASWKDKYVYTANSNCVRKILPEVLPYLVAKREQAMLLLKFVSLVKPAQKARLQPRAEKQSLYSRLRILNRKGKGRNKNIAC